MINNKKQNQKVRRWNCLNVHTLTCTTSFVCCCEDSKKKLKTWRNRCPAVQILVIMKYFLLQMRILLTFAIRHILFLWEKWIVCMWRLCSVESAFWKWLLGSLCSIPKVQHRKYGLGSAVLIGDSINSAK